MRERLWDRYRVFRSVAERGDDGAWYWEERPGDHLAEHITEMKLADPGDDAALQDFIGSQRTSPLDRDKPLWRMFFVDGYKGGSAIVIRTHHAIADGIRMVQLAMSLFDAAPEGGAILPSPVHLRAAMRQEASRPGREQLRSTAKAVVTELAEPRRRGRPCRRCRR